MFENNLQKQEIFIWDTEIAQLHNNETSKQTMNLLGIVTSNKAIINKIFNGGC
jgi:hypothetical protein